MVDNAQPTTPTRNPLPAIQTHQPARVALIGYGLAGSAFHAPLIVAVQRLRLDAIVTRDPARRAQAQRDHPQARIIDTADQLWQNAHDYELIVVATPNSTHVPLALAAIRAGIAVVVDKPFAPTPEEGRAVVEEAKKQRVLLTVFQNRRWDGDYLTVRRLLAEDALGTVFRFESRFERWRPIPKRGWRELSDPNEAGGVLYDLGSHLIDQALQLFGPVAAVYAELQSRREGWEVDDDAFVALTHASGVRSHISVGTLVSRQDARYRLLGSRAGYVKFGVDVQEAALRAGERADRPDWGEEPSDHWGTLGAGDDVRPVRTERGDYVAYYRAVAAAILDGSPPPVDPSDAVRGLEIIAAARRSAAGRSVVTLI